MILKESKGAWVGGWLARLYCKGHLWPTATAPVVSWPAALGYDLFVNWGWFLWQQQLAKACPFPPVQWQNEAAKAKEWSWGPESLRELFFAQGVIFFWAKLPSLLYKEHCIFLILGRVTATSFFFLSNYLLSVCPPLTMNPSQGLRSLTPSGEGARKFMWAWKLDCLVSNLYQWPALCTSLSSDVKQG